MTATGGVDLTAYDAWLFDLDGVVTDTARVHAAAWKAARVRDFGPALDPLRAAALFDLDDVTGSSSGVCTSPPWEASGRPWRPAWPA